MVDYYDEERPIDPQIPHPKPICRRELRSGFGMRYHPILLYARMPYRVDWSNAIGTPILAAGNGTIIKAEFTSGYGRRVEISTPTGYVRGGDLFAHVGVLRAGCRGRRVVQGQVIGYLGQSGLATAPHLHYEVSSRPTSSIRWRSNSQGLVNSMAKCRHVKRGARAHRPDCAPGAQCDAVTAKSH